VNASEEEIACSLEGNWQEDLLFLLKQEQEGYEFYQRQMAECDQRLQQYLQQREDRSVGTSLPEEKRKERLKKKKVNKPRFGLRAELFRMTGTDLTQIDGIDVRTAATVISEAGWDMSKWRTEACLAGLGVVRQPIVWTGSWDWLKMRRLEEGPQCRRHSLQRSIARRRSSSPGGTNFITNSRRPE
jgi:hypothetical protein